MKFLGEIIMIKSVTLYVTRSEKQTTFNFSSKCGRGCKVSRVDMESVTKFLSLNLYTFSYPWT